MSDRAAFVAAIQASPADDLPRLAFADYLDDRGNARDRKRAELIRVQCELARRPDAGLSRRAEELLDVIGRVWPNDLLAGRRFGGPELHTGRPLRSHFQRGCLHAVELSGQSAARHLAAFAGREPLLDVVLTLWEPPPDGLADCPHLARVGTLRGHHLRLLLDSPHLTGLRGVEGCQPADVSLLATTPAATRVDRLEVRGSRADEPAAPTGLSRALADTPAFAGLRSLALRDAGFAASDYRRLIASPHLSPALRLDTEGRGAVRRGSAVARDLLARFAGPEGRP